jgi:hypothetical protein
MTDLLYKDYRIVGDGTYGYKEIKPVAKGSVHQSLRGKYTTAVKAQKDIDTYLESKVVKGGKED